VTRGLYVLLPHQLVVFLVFHRAKPPLRRLCTVKSLKLRVRADLGFGPNRLDLNPKAFQLLVERSFLPVSQRQPL
jgi:hypothetical protein